MLILNLKIDETLGPLKPYICTHLIQKVVIFVWMFGCPIITQKPLTDLFQIFIGEIGRNTEMFFVWLKQSLLG